MTLHYGLPPYADIVFRADIRGRLTEAQLGIMCHMIALAQPSGDGGWVVALTQPRLAEHIGVPVDRLSRELKAIAVTGLLAIEKGPRHGRGRGSGNDCYWLYPSLLTGAPASVPPPPDRGPRSRDHAVTGPGNGDPHFGVLHSGDPHPRHLVAVSPQRAGLDPGETAVSSDRVVVEGRQSSHQQQEDPGETAVSGVPPAVSAALDEIGWTADPPLGQPVDLLLAVIRSLQKQRRAGQVNSEARVLHSLLRRPDGLVKFARSNHLLGTDLNGSLPGSPDVPRMSGLDYDQLAADHPQWAHSVMTEAKRQASLRGLLPKIPPSLIWEVAASMPVPQAVQDAN
jgi:hypothetical protein